MPPVRPTPADRPDPQFAKPAMPGAPLRFPAEGRRGERQAPAFTAGERLAVSSEITSGDEGRRDDGTPGPRFGVLRLTVLAVLVVLAGIGAMTVYRAVAGVLSG